MPFSREWSSTICKTGCQQNVLDMRLRAHTSTEDWLMFRRGTKRWIAEGDPRWTERAESDVDTIHVE